MTFSQIANNSIVCEALRNSCITIINNKPRNKEGKKEIFF